jgi:hypothetical protein
VEGCDDPRGFSPVVVDFAGSDIILCGGGVIALLDAGCEQPDQVMDAVSDKMGTSVVVTGH